jgi:hypothetical protein
MTNLLYNGPVFRALSVALDRWVTNGTFPPRSVSYPSAATVRWCPPEQANYPAIPVTHYAGGPALPAFDYTA